MRVRHWHMQCNARRQPWACQFGHITPNRFARGVLRLLLVLPLIDSNHHLRSLVFWVCCSVCIQCHSDYCPILHCKSPLHRSASPRSSRGTSNSKQQNHPLHCHWSGWLCTSCRSIHPWDHHVVRSSSTGSAWVCINPYSPCSVFIIRCAVFQSGIIAFDTLARSAFLLCKKVGWVACNLLTSQ